LKDQHKKEVGNGLGEKIGVEVFELLAARASKAGGDWARPEMWGSSRGDKKLDKRANDFCEANEILANAPAVIGNGFHVPDKPG